MLTEEEEIAKFLERAHTKLTSCPAIYDDASDYAYLSDAGQCVCEVGEIRKAIAERDAFRREVEELRGFKESALNTQADLEEEAEDREAEAASLRSEVERLKDELEFLKAAMRRYFRAVDRWEQEPLSSPESRLLAMETGDAAQAARAALGPSEKGTP